MSEDMVMFGDEEVSLAVIAEIDLSEVAENYQQGFEALPKGLYEFAVVETDIVAITYKDAKSGEDVTKPMVQINVDVENPIQLNPEMDDSDELIGRRHNESFFITDPKKDLGNVKAFLVASGFEGNGSLTELLDGFVGHRFMGVIEHKKNKKDPDNPRAYLNLKKLGPVGEAVEAE